MDFCIHLLLLVLNFCFLEKWEIFNIFFDILDIQPPALFDGKILSKTVGLLLSLDRGEELGGDGRLLQCCFFENKNKLTFTDILLLKKQGRGGGILILCLSTQLKTF